MLLGNKNNIIEFISDIVTERDTGIYFLFNIINLF